MAIWRAKQNNKKNVQDFLTDIFVRKSAINNLDTILDVCGRAEC